MDGQIGKRTGGLPPVKYLPKRMDADLDLRVTVSSGRRPFPERQSGNPKLTIPAGRRDAR
jgi:hypothetical protein